MSQSNKLKLGSTLVAMTATKDVNVLTNQPFSVINVLTKDKQIISPQILGVQNGGTVSFEWAKTCDYSQRLQLRTIYNRWAAPAPAANVADTCFVEDAGTRLVEHVQINYTNKRLTSSSVPFLWSKLLRWFNKDMSYRVYTDANNLENASQIERHNALINGYTFFTELETGFQHDSRENLIMLSVLGSKIIVQVKLAAVGDLVAGFTAAPNNVPAPWISAIHMMQNCYHINPNERLDELDNHEEGVYNMIRVFSIQQDVIPQNTGTRWDLELKFSGYHEIVFFIFQPTRFLAGNGAVTNDPCSVIGANAAHPENSVTVVNRWTPSFRSNNVVVSGETSYNMPQLWEFKMQNNNVVYAEDVWHNLTYDRQHQFGPCQSFEAPNGIIILPFCETFKHNDNSILGHMDFQTATQRTATFYWRIDPGPGGGVPVGTTGPTTPALAPNPGVNIDPYASATMTVTTIACGPDFVESVGGGIHAIFNL